MKKKILFLTLTASLLFVGCNNSKNTVTEKETNTKSPSVTQQESETETVEANSHVDNGFKLYDVGTDEKIVDIAKDGYFVTSTHLYRWDSISDELSGLELSIEPKSISKKSNFSYVLIIENKDGTYSFCDVNALSTVTTVFDELEVTDELLVEGISIKNQHELVNATCSWSKDSIYFYTLCDGKLYITEYDKDGNVDAEMNYVEMKIQIDDEEGYRAGEIKDYRGGYLEDYVLFSDGKLYETDMGNVICSVDTDDETDIKTYYSSCEKEYMADIDVDSIFYDSYAYSTSILRTKKSDLNNLYVKADFDFKKNAYTYETLPMPEGYTINDISEMCVSNDEIYIITNDNKVIVYAFCELENGEYGEAWKEDEYLTDMMAKSELIEIAAFDDVEFLFSDGKIYSK